MPQGLTYWDMGRMLRAQIPEGLYRLELNEQFIGKGKMVGREHLDSCLQEDFEFYLQPKKNDQDLGESYETFH